MPKSDQEKAEIRRLTEARRQPGKDRAKHDADRGVALETLEDLSKGEPKAHEIAQLAKAIENESDRSVALIHAAIVENGLFWALNCRFPEQGDDVRNAIFSSSGAPIGSFSAKIIMARGVGIIKQQSQDELNLIRRIRNAFAHSFRPIDFSHPTIEAACSKFTFLQQPPPLPEKNTSRSRFILASSYLFAGLIDNATLQPGKSFTHSMP